MVILSLLTLDLIKAQASIKLVMEKIWILKAKIVTKLNYQVSAQFREVEISQTLTVPLMIEQAKALRRNNPGLEANNRT